MKKLHHIVIGDTPLCSWLGCAAGRDITERAGVRTCTAVSGAEARRMAARLQPNFRVPVRAVAGECPSFEAGR
jgi:hypothetical protein